MRVKPIITILGLVAACGFGARVEAAPDEVKRVVRTFDFEERRLGNPEDLPMHWVKVAGPGYPHYVNGRLATGVSRSGKYAFRFDLDGGSLAYRYEANRIKVMAGAHYRIETAVRTTLLTQARAVMTAWLVDQDGHLLPKTVRYSAPYAARNADDGWQLLKIELSVDEPQAAFLVLELGLLQPGEFVGGVLGQRTLNVQDIRGTAWFDDLTISQVPRVIMSTDRPANVFKRGEPVRLVVRVDDRFTDDLAAQIVVTDADGKTVYQRSGTTELSRAEQVGPGRKRLPIDLPELPAGYYRASLVMSSQGQTLGAQSLGFIQLADANPPTTPDGRFGFSATSLPLAGWDDLAAVLPLLSAGRVKLALWGPEGDVLEVDPAKFDAVLEKLQERGITPTACLIGLPPDLARKMKSSGLSEKGAGGSAWWGGEADKRGAGIANTLPPSYANSSSSWPLLLKSDVKLWQPRLSFLVSRHANHLDRWQLGADGDDGFASDPELRKVYDVIYAQFQRLVQKPDLAMPWPVWYELNGHTPATVALSVPPTVVLPSQVPLYINDAGMASPAGSAGSGAPPATMPATGPTAPTSPSWTRPTNISVYLSWLDTERYGRAERIRDMAQRVIHTFAANADRIDLPLPLTVRKEQDVLVHEPSEELLLLRTIISTLSGATFRGKVPIAEGIEAFLFDRGGQGILAVWDLGAQGGVRELSVNLGRQPTMIDLWGNVSPVQKVPGKEGLVALRVSRTPIFLADIDGQLMQTRASVALDRPLIESSFQPHTRKLRFTNNYRNAIGGTVRLKPPPGWGINPPTFTFSLNPGETFDREITLELPYNSVAGPKAIGAHFVLQADGIADFTVPITVNLGLSDVGMQTIAVRDGNDLIVQQMITNYGDKPIDYTAFAVYPGQSRQERLISGLGAGKTTIRRYKFPSVDFKVGGKVRAGVKEMVGTRILNDEVAVQ
ncbi:hypothetical protein [Humisphaera borealis]|uniref:Uncharacterized protein n=1 Tax=Humisphaera borealis TaxID=2807512 RepID=A0A7M2X0T8_9BACT|nr:hypothetical protein [Humisphaera borealis]QOV90350.1 hypothetical protein IPV69_02980 [Humisphaera borealis]